MDQPNLGAEVSSLLQPHCAGISLLTLGNAKVSRTLLPTLGPSSGFSCVSPSPQVQPLEDQDKRWSQQPSPHSYLSCPVGLGIQPHIS